MRLVSQTKVITDSNSDCVRTNSKRTIRLKDTANQKNEHRNIRRRRVIWTVMIVVCTLLLIPFPTLLSPDFTVSFVNSEGNPVSDMKVRRTCTHYTYESINNHCAEDWDHAPKTDSDGKVSFSSRYVWYGAASRAVRALFSYILLIAHGSVGRHITLFTAGNDSGLKSYGISIDPNDPNKEITLTDKEVERHNLEVSSRR